MTNSTVIEVTYENGILRPTQPLDLADHQVVHISLHSEATINDHLYITQTPGICGGRPVIKGTRIPVKTLIKYYQLNYSVTEILEGFPDLTTAQLYDALSYYYDHQADLDADMQADKLPAILERFALEIDSDGILHPTG